jgi:hypothetical protein
MIYMFSDQGQDNKIQSNSPDSYTTQPDEWQMPDNINLDSSGLQRSTRSAVLGWQDKVYPIPQPVSRHKSKEVWQKHAWFSSLLSEPLALD